MSPYFADLLTGGFSESSTDEIFIDIDPKGFKHIINYLFYGSVIPLKYKYLFNYFCLENKSTDNKPPDEPLTVIPDIKSSLTVLNMSNLPQCKSYPRKVLKLLDFNTYRSCSEYTQRISADMATEDGISVFKIPRVADLLEKIRIHVTTTNNIVDKFWPFSAIENISLFIYGSNTLIASYDSLSLFIFEEINNTTYYKKIEKQFRKRDKHAIITLDFSKEKTIPLCALVPEFCIKIKWQQDPMRSVNQSFFPGSNPSEARVSSFLEAEMSMLSNEDRIRLSDTRFKTEFYSSFIKDVKGTICNIDLTGISGITKIIIVCFCEDPAKPDLSPTLSVDPAKPDLSSTLSADPISKRWKFYRISRFKLLLNDVEIINLDERSLIMRMLEVHKGKQITKYPIYEWAVKDIDSAIRGIGKNNNPRAEVYIPDSALGDFNSQYDLKNTCNTTQKKILIGIQNTRTSWTNNGSILFNEVS